MTRISLVLSFIILIFSVQACKKDTPKYADCWVKPKRTQLRLNVIEGPEVTLPAKISIFFKVTDLNNNPVGYLTENNFIIYEKGQNDECNRIISENEAKRKISGREQVFNHTTVLVIDLSGSVVGPALTELQKAVLAFIEQIIPVKPDPSIKMGIWWFAGEDKLHVLRNVTSDIFELRAAVNSIASNMSNDNSTDLYGSVIKATDIAQGILNEYKAAEITASVSVVVFTDGRDRANRYTKAAVYGAVAAAPREISFFTLGVGNEISQEDLTSIGRNGHALAVKLADLTTIFKQIAQIVSNEANSYYLFEYCSPIRSGAKNTLIIEAYEKNRVGFMEATFDATGFTGGCQL